ncbi:hypothetical protein FRC08_006318 [Ceratobasidium sp. 394]|nr:hypothetical protein FRC08_006318 [Ceratobasidium sp. 394]
MTWRNVSAKEGKRHFLFGKLHITDQADLAPLDDPTQTELNTIKLKLSWVRGCKKVYNNKAPESPESNDEEGSGESSVVEQPSVRWVNEKLVQKGHNGSAELGPPEPTCKPAPAPPSDGQKKQPRPYHYEYNKADKPPLFFVFHYAPKDWLQDKGIIRQPLPVPIIDLSNTPANTPQPRATEINTLQHRLALQEPEIHLPTPISTNNADRLALEKSWPPLGGNLAESLAPTTQQEFLTTAQGESESAGNDDPAIHVTDLNNETRASPPSLNRSEPRQPTPHSLLPIKREREPTPLNTIDVDVIPSDDEIVLLDVKPPKQKPIKRPRIKYEEDSKPTMGGLETKPNVFNQPEIDLWRLGC